jgi:hypothetical protein
VKNLSGTIGFSVSMYANAGEIGPKGRFHPQSDGWMQRLGRVPEGGPMIQRNRSVVLGLTEKHLWLLFRAATAGCTTRTGCSLNSWCRQPKQMLDGAIPSLLLESQKVQCRTFSLRTLRLSRPTIQFLCGVLSALDDVLQGFFHSLRAALNGLTN